MPPYALLKGNTMRHPRTTDTLVVQSIGVKRVATGDRLSLRTGEPRRGDSHLTVPYCIAKQKRRWQACMHALTDNVAFKCFHRRLGKELDFEAEGRDQLGSGLASKRSSVICDSSSRRVHVQTIMPASPCTPKRLCTLLPLLTSV